MTHSLLTKISKHRLFKALQEAPAPRWVIFSLDMLIVAMVALMLLMFQPLEMYEVKQLYAYILVVGMYALMNLLTGSYKCIVRLSMPYDLLKVFWCVLLSSIGICVVSFCCALIINTHTPLIGIFPIFLIGTMVMCLMVSLRIIVKYLFIHISEAAEKRENVIILGTAINSLAMAITLRNEVKGQFMPVALLALDGQHNQKKIQGLPVEEYDSDRIEEIFAQYNAKTLVFLQTQTPLMRSGLAEQFMNAHINLKVLNQIDEFDVDADSQSPNISAHVNAFKIEDLLGRQVIKTDSQRVKQVLHGNTVMITGAAGSIGSEIVRQVASFGAECIVLLDQAETPMHDMQLEMEANFPNIKIVLYVADVQNRQRLERAFREYRPQYVFHAAAYKHVPMMERNPTEAILTNVMGTKNLADLSLEFGVKKFVMVSTDKAVNPTNIMGCTKRIAEIYVQSLFYHASRINDGGISTQYITTRFGNVLGSNGSVIPLFRRQIEAGGPITVTHKDIIRYFMTIKEACSLVLEAGCMGHGGEIFLFDMGEPVRIYDLARRMILLAGYKPNVDIQIVETGLRPGEKLYEELLNDKEKTLPTDNEKIMIAKVRKYDFQSVVPLIEQMIALAKEGKVHDMVMTMKGLVPEYISNNSIFESIDKELHHTKESVSECELSSLPPQIYKSMNIKYLAASVILSASCLSAHAWDLKDLLNKAGSALGNSQNSSASSAITDIANGLFAKSDLTVEDLAGTWTVAGSAVCFQSDNFMQQAGGKAAAAIVENKIDPYYQKYGLTGSTLTIDKEGNFTLQMKKLKLTGTVTEQKEEKGKMTQGGNFYFNFNKFGANSLGSINTYVNKGLTNMDIMFDASKLRAILNAVASFSKIKMAQTATDILNSYDGICIGFELTSATPTSGKKK